MINCQCVAQFLVQCPCRSFLEKTQLQEIQRQKKELSVYAKPRGLLQLLRQTEPSHLEKHLVGCQELAAGSVQSGRHSECEVGLGSHLGEKQLPVWRNQN